MCPCLRTPALDKIFGSRILKREFLYTPANTYLRIYDSELLKLLIRRVVDIWLLFPDRAGYFWVFKTTCIFGVNFEQYITVLLKTSVSRRISSSNAFAKRRYAKISSHVKYQICPRGIQFKIWFFQIYIPSGFFSFSFSNPAYISTSQQKWICITFPQCAMTIAIYNGKWTFKYGRWTRFLL